MQDIKKHGHTKHFIQRISNLSHPEYPWFMNLLPSAFYLEYLFSCQSLAVTDANLLPKLYTAQAAL
jgi:hypothetical protein